MVPDLHTVLRWRMVVRAWLRLLGLLTLPFRAGFIVGGLIEGISDDDLWSWRSYFQRVATGTVPLFWGITGLVFAGPLTRVILPLPRGRWPGRCPSCRHESVSLAEARCPECGRGLTEELVKASHNRPGGGA